ncbi:hypothetical protein WDW37_17160 [Bdellovibrionota bacterium FG-1]
MADTKHHAFALYVEKGWSLRRITSELGIGKATVERWSSAECWGIQRQRAWSAKREAVIKAHVENGAIRDKGIGGKLYAIIQDGFLDHRAFYEGKIPKRAIRYSTQELCALVKALTAVGDSDLRKAVYEDHRSGLLISE